MYSPGGILCSSEPGLSVKSPEWESLFLKQNTATTEDDTLMGTDVSSNVISRLMQFGVRCGRDRSTLTCVHYHANCGHQIPVIWNDRDRELNLKDCQQHKSFGLCFLTGWRTILDVSSVDNRGFTVSQNWLWLKLTITFPSHDQGYRASPVLCQLWVTSENCTTPV